MVARFWDRVDMGHNNVVTTKKTQEPGWKPAPQRQEKANPRAQPGMAVSQEVRQRNHTGVEADWVSFTILPSKRWTVRSAWLE
jgi:hypothetical protein